MSLATRITVHELTLARRDGRIWLMLVLALILGLAAAWLTAQNVARHNANRSAALTEERHTWDHLGPLNPHSAAHFSHYAFRPQTGLSAFQPGLSAVQGEAIWMEAHRQNPANFRPVEDAGDARRFADLSPFWLIVTLLPLFLIAAGHGLAAAERESGQWRLLLTGPVQQRQWLVGKGSALVLLGLTVAGLFTLPALITTADLPAPVDASIRWSGIIVMICLYTLAWAAMVLAVSATARSVRSALVALVVLWMALVVLAPRLAGTTAALLAPAPTPQLFQAMVREDIEKGMDGHSPQDARREAFEADVLRRYGVERLEELPVSFAGLALQESERYGNIVFDRHYGTLARAQADQETVVLVFGAFSPAIALDQVTAGLSGTDISHYWHFARAAEAHRRATIAELNDDMTKNGAGRDFDYLADNALWQRVRYFDYQLPGWRIASNVPLAGTMLLAWAALAWGLAALSLRRWQRL